MNAQMEVPLAMNLQKEVPFAMTAQLAQALHRLLLQVDYLS